MARLVRLTSRLNGLLIDRRAGFDILKRRHDLVVALDRKLVHAWTDAEGPGPTWSTVVVANSGPNTSEQILAFDGFRQPSSDQPDKLRFATYEWNPDTSKLEGPVDGSPPLYVVIAGKFKSVSEAHAAQAQSECLSAFWVLKSDGFISLEPGTFVLAAVSTKKPLAVEKSRVMKSCAPESSTSVIESLYRPSD